VTTDEAPKRTPIAIVFGDKHRRARWSKVEKRRLREDGVLSCPKCSERIRDASFLSVHYPQYRTSDAGFINKYSSRIQLCEAV